MMGKQLAVISSIEGLFTQGKYSELLGNYFDTEAADIGIELKPLLIGALVFAGRGAEAVSQFARIRDELSPDGFAECRFFLIIYSVRSANLRAAEDALAEAEVEEREGRAPSARASFFRHQSVAFFNYYLGRKARAKEAAQRALEAAVDARSLWGRTLALDLLSHLSFQDGQIQQSLKNFAQCIEIAEKLGNTNLAEAFRLAMTLYRAQVNVPTLEQIALLESMLDETRIEDTYSRANILLELARQTTLVGQWARAEQFLNRALTFIYQFANAKQEVVLNFRWSYLAFCQGDFERALNLIAVSKSKAELVREEPLTLAIYGLELDILSRMNFGPEFLRTRASALEALQATHSSHVNARIRGRRGLAVIERRRGEDPFADWLDEISGVGRAADHASSALAPEAFERILSAGVFGLLRTKGFVPPKGLGLVVDHSRRLVIFSDAQSIEVIEFGSRRRLFELFEALLGGFIERGELFASIWGTRYVPHLHDSVIYTNFTNLRKLLGRFASFIQTGEKGYSLNADVQVVLVDSAASDVRMSAQPTTRGLSEAMSSPTAAGAGSAAAARGGALKIERHAQWNERQSRLLGSMSPADLIDTRTYARLFEISTATANRDLRELHSAKRLKRQGSSRDIAYALV